MAKYIMKRLLLMIPVLLGVAIMIFTILYFVPGDPVKIMLGSTATEEEIAITRASYGLDQPFFKRLVNYIVGIVTRFDFGKSYSYGTSVTTELLQRFPRTFILACSSIFLSLLIGLPLGIVAATHHNTIWDRISIIISIIGVSMPVFWLAMMLVILFSLKLGWLPSYGIGGVKYFILPAVANCMGGIAGIARQTRSSVLENIRADYVTTAESKGISERQVLWQHIMPNSLIPIVTYCGTQFSGLLGGAVIIENVFSIPGLGSYMVKAIGQRDYNVVQGSVIFTAFTFGMVMLIVDIIYAFIDPRIKAQYERNRRKKKNDAE